MRFTTANLPVADGTQLHLRHWLARAGTRGTVLMVHGLGEHIGRYQHVADRLLDNGWDVYGYDHRGHGKSVGKRGVLARPDNLLTDLAAVIDHVRARSNGPLVLLGHSMGGLVVSRFVAESLAPQPAAWAREVDGLVMSSPALDAGLNAFQNMLLATLHPLVPNLAIGNGLDAKWLSHDPTTITGYRDDPWVHDRISPRLLRFIVDGGAEVLARAPQWRIPTLLIYAGGDRIVSPAGSAAFAKAAPASVVRTQCFDDMYHEIFNELHRERPLNALVQWLYIAVNAPLAKAA